MVVANPISQSIVVGDNVSFSAAANDGNPTPTNVQWQISPDGGNTFTNLSGNGLLSGDFYNGGTSLAMTIYGASATLSGDEFRAIFSNAAGLTATTSAATLTVQVPASIVPFSGALQSATVGTAFSPLEALVTDSLGNPVSGASVTFIYLVYLPPGQIAVAGGTVAGGDGVAVVTTNAEGIAIAPTLTANDVTGSYTVTASISGVTGAADFNLTNTPGAPKTITAVSGPPLNAPINTSYGNLLQAEVVDAYGNPVANIPVTFAAPLAGPSGTFDALTTVPTNALGIATAPAFTANHILGTFTVTATAVGVASSADFTLTNTAVPASIRSVAGTPQHATVYMAYKAPLQARVTDIHGNPVVGITVVFELPDGASGTFAGPPDVVTGANGVATAPALTANTTAGTFTVDAWVAGVAVPAAFSLTNTVGPAAGISPVVSSLSGTVGKPYATALQALVTDSYGNPISGAKVTFTVTAGRNEAGRIGGSFTFIATTGANGVAKASLTADTIAGTFTVSAAVSGVNAPASFSLTNLAGPAAKIVPVTGTTPQTTTTNSAFPVDLGVVVTDSYGNDIAGSLVTFTVHANAASGAGAEFSGSTTATATTNANGVASATLLTANAKKGTITVITSIAGLTQSPVFTLTID